MTCQYRFELGTPVVTSYDGFKSAQFGYVTERSEVVTSFAAEPRTSYSVSWPGRTTRFYWEEEIAGYYKNYLHYARNFL